jgi:hypothetical protein
LLFHHNITFVTSSVVFSLPALHTIHNTHYFIPATLCTTLASHLCQNLVWGHPLRCCSYGFIHVKTWGMSGCLYKLSSYQIWINSQMRWYQCFLRHTESLWPLHSSFTCSDFRVEFLSTEVCVEMVQCPPALVSCYMPLGFPALVPALLSCVAVMHFSPRVQLSMLFDNSSRNWSVAVKIIPSHVQMVSLKWLYGLCLQNGQIVFPILLCCLHCEVICSPHFSNHRIR